MVDPRKNEAHLREAIAGGHSSSVPDFGTLDEALAHFAAEQPDAGALTYFGRTFTYGELAELTSRTAAGLRDRGVVYGERIVVQLQNQPEFVLTALAAWRLGAVVVPVSPMYSTREVRRIIADAEPTAIVLSRSTWEHQGPASIEGTSVRLVVTTGFADFAKRVPDVFEGLEDPPTAAEAPGEVHVTGFEALVAHAPGHAGPSPTADDLAVLAYTSGTTGAPKGAMITHGGSVWSGTSYVRANEFDGPGEVVLAVAPLVHITGLALHLAAALCSGARLVLGYRFHAGYYLDLFGRERVTWTTGSPTAYIAMLAELEAQPVALPYLRGLGSGGAPIPTEIAARIEAAFGVVLGTGYGLTESTAASVTTPAGERPRIDEESGIISVGVPMFDTRVRVVDEHGDAVSFGVRGELALSGPAIMRGYWRNKAETESTLAEGWLRTGDVGFIDADEWVYIVDRTKNVIVASGYKVWPREVEDVLYQLPHVREAAVVGLPDPYRGETVVAVVVPALNVDIDVEEVVAHCRRNLAAYKVPRRIDVVAEIPKNFNGKIVHRDVRASLLADRAAPAGQ